MGWAAGEEVNLEDIEVSQEFLREGLGDGVFAPPFIAAAFSEELLREKLGRCGIGLGAEGISFG